MSGGQIQNSPPVLLGFVLSRAGEQPLDSLKNSLGLFPFLWFVGDLDFHGFPPAFHCAISLLASAA